MTRFVAQLAELSQHDVEIAGGKGANLGELASAGLPVPAGFVVTAEAYLHSMEAGGVRDDLRSAVAAAGEKNGPERLQALVGKAGIAPDVE